MKMEDENEDEWQMVPLFEVRASFEVVQLLFISSFPLPPNSLSRVLLIMCVPRYEKGRKRGRRGKMELCVRIVW